MIFQESNITVQGHTLVMELAPRLSSKVKYLFQESANNRVMQEATVKNLLGQLCLKHGRLWSLMQHQDTVLSILVACEFYLFHQEWQPQALSGMDSKLCIQSFHLPLHPKNQPSEGKQFLLASLFTSSRERDAL